MLNTAIISFKIMNTMILVNLKMQIYSTKLQHQFIKHIKFPKAQLIKESDVNVIIVTARRDFDDKELFFALKTWNKY